MVLAARLTAVVALASLASVAAFHFAGRRPARTGPLFAVKPQVVYDNSFTLEDAEWAQLDAYLTHKDMIRKVCDEAACRDAIFTGAVFKPVAFTAETPHGMPASIEQFHHSEKFVICNVPAIVLFKAKILRPQKLCAVYEMLDPSNPNPNNNSAYRKSDAKSDDSDDLWLPDDGGDEDDFDYEKAMI